MNTPVNNNDFDFGMRIKALRESLNLSQRELARRAGIANTTISLIESNQISPSVGLLKKLLDGVPTTFSEFFCADPKETKKYFFPAAELTEILIGEVSYRQVGSHLTQRSVQLLHERYEPKAESGGMRLSHEGEEAGIILSGWLEVTVGDQRKILGPGDAYYFPSDIPHRFRNVSSDACCELISACTPPSF